MTDISGLHVLMATVLATATGVGTAADTGAPVSEVDPVAIEALGAMSTHLRSLPHYAIDADISKDKVIDGNGKLQFDHEFKVLFARGKGLSIDSSSALRHLQYFYNNKQLTLALIFRRPGDTIEVRWVYTSSDVKPGKGLGSCLSKACANPKLLSEIH